MVGEGEPLRIFSLLLSFSWFGQAWTPLLSSPYPESFLLPCHILCSQPVC